MAICVKTYNKILSPLLVVCVQRHSVLWALFLVKRLCLPSVWPKSGWACAWSPPTRRYIAWHENKKYIFIVSHKGLTCETRSSENINRWLIPTAIFQNLTQIKKLQLYNWNVVIFLLWRTLFGGGSPVKIYSHIRSTSGNNGYIVCKPLRCIIWWRDLFSHYLRYSCKKKNVGVL